MTNSKSNQELKIGDTVQLKSGGPFMTVNKIDENGEINCKWFTKDEDEVRNSYFPPNSLQKKGEEDSRGPVSRIDKKYFKED